MKTELYAMRDVKVGNYLPPLVCLNLPDALRRFTGFASKPGTDVFQYPEEFEIYKLGTYNDENAQIVTEPIPTFIVNVKELVEALHKKMQARQEREEKR